MLENVLGVAWEDAEEVLLMLDTDELVDGAARTSLKICVLNAFRVSTSCII